MDNIKGNYFLGIGVSGQEFDERIIEHISHHLQKMAATRLACIATIDKRGCHPLIDRLRIFFQVPVFLFTIDELEAQKLRLANPCSRLYKRLGCHGVAEAAALAAVGERGQLILPKTVLSGKTTIALAQENLKEKQ